MNGIFNNLFILKFLKFGVVGFSGVVIDFGFTYLCKEILKIPKYISNAIGFTIAASSNYVLNRIWTFQSQNPHISVEFLKFFCISLFGLGINTFILWTLVNKFNRKFYFSKLVAIAIVTIWNFMINLIFTFK